MDKLKKPKLTDHQRHTLRLLGVLALVGIALFAVLYWQIRRNQTVYVLSKTSVDSVGTKPSKEEQDTERDWYELKKIQP